MYTKSKEFNFDISFITLCYNQTDLITEHLNSLLYQIKNNLQSYSVQLIISDDASIDNTVEKINLWLSDNGHYFQDVIILTKKSNQGTCKSFVRAVKSSSGKYIKLLAGDDIYLKEDISKVISQLSHKDIILTPSLPFYENDTNNINKIKFNKTKYLIRQYLDLGYENIKKRLLSAPETPGIFLNSTLFTDYVLDFISRYDLIEDRSFWISVLEENEHLKIGYIEKPYIGYRQHLMSVTKSFSSPVAIRYKKDQKMLSLYQIENCRSYGTKASYAYDYYFNKSNFRFKKYFNIKIILFNINFYINYLLKKNY